MTDVGAAVGFHVRTLALEVGGYVGGSQAGSSDESATLTLRVPAAAFDEALEGLRALEARSSPTDGSESDVTRQIIDPSADRTSRPPGVVRALVERAERVEDILASLVAA